MVEKKLTDLTKKLNKYQKKVCNILLGRMCFTEDDGYQIVLVFAPMS